MSGVQSIERAFSILRVLVHGPLGVTEIADRSDLPKSTVSRLLAALEAEGAVEHVEVGGGYSIGTALATLGASSSPRAGLRSMVRPLIEELAMLTGGSAGFTIREGDAAYWVDDVDDANDLVKLADQTGQTFPLHTIPSGIAILAKFSTDDLEAYLSEPTVHGRRRTARRRGTPPPHRPGRLRRRRLLERGVPSRRQRDHGGVSGSRREMGGSVVSAGSVVPLPRSRRRAPGAQAGERSSDAVERTPRQ